MGSRKRRFPNAWLALTLPLLVGCSHPTLPAGEQPLELLAPTPPTLLDPRFSTGSLDIKVTRLVHAGLVGLEPSTLEPVPLVAAAWHFRDDRTLDVELKAGVRFHSGRPLSPADVCATLSAIADPALRSPHREIVRAIGECEVEGPLSIRIHLSQARATLLTDLEVPVLRADQARLPPHPDGDLDGLGPYTVARATEAAVELAPADTGVLPRPRHAVVILTVRDENARALRLLAGRADVAPNGISATLLPALDGRGGLSIRSRSGANVTYLLMQNDRAPFNRVEVRHAIARAIDRELVVRTLLAGRAQLASQLLPPGHWAYNPALQPEPYDPAEARSVLAGLPPMTLLTSTERARVTIARVIAQMLGDAGLEVRVVPLDLGVLLERLDAGDYALATLQMPEITEPNVLKWFFSPAGVPGEGGSGKNRARYRSATAGRLLDDASMVADTARRRELYHQLAEVMASDLPVIPLWHEDQIAVVSPRAADFLPSAEGRWLSIAALR